jgi:hypothetical protein
MPILSLILSFQKELRQFNASGPKGFDRFLAKFIIFPGLMQFW